MANKKATLHGPTGETEVVDVGSRRASELMGQGFTLKPNQPLTGNRQIEESFKLPELRRESLKFSLGQFLLPGLIKQGLEGRESEADLLGRAGKSFEGIKNPSVRNRLLEMTRQGRNQGIAGIIEQAQNTFQAEGGQRQATLQSAEQQAGEKKGALREQQQRKERLDDMQKELAMKMAFSRPTGDNPGTPDRLLTIAEAKSLNVPVGTMLSQVIGQTPDQPYGTKSFDDFKKDFLNVTPASFEDSTLQDFYQTYLEAKSAIDSNPSIYGQTVADPDVQPFSFMLQPPNQLRKPTLSLQEQLAQMLGGAPGGFSSEASPNGE